MDANKDAQISELLCIASQIGPISTNYAPRSTQGHAHKSDHAGFTVLLLTATEWNQVTYPPTEEYINKRWCVQKTQYWKSPKYERMLQHITGELRTSSVKRKMPERKKNKNKKQTQAHIV